ncbi:MAG: hypothetical protein IJE07_02520 [Clostridia bacterium]|nr:hypothetical protein [Clostridia bacterium]
MDWLTTGGLLKTIGRVVMLIGIAAAVVILAIGFKEIYDAAVAEREASYEKQYASQQKSEFNKKTRENNKAIKNGEEPPHELPETYQEYVLPNPPVVRLDLESQMGTFVTGYLGWAILPLAGGIFLGWIIGNVMSWFRALRKAGPVRVTAGAFLWVGIIIAGAFLLAGLWHVVNIRSSTLPEVGKILMENYLIWSAAALGCGYGIQQIILKAKEMHTSLFGVDKGTPAGKILYLAVYFAGPFVLAACVMAGICFGWGVGVGAAAVYAVVLLGAWALSGTSPMTRTKEEIEAERARRARTSWTCDGCGTENNRSDGFCSNCGEVKPLHHM